MNRITKMRIASFEDRMAALPPEKQYYIMGRLDDLFDRSLARAKEAQKARKEADESKTA